MPSRLDVELQRAIGRRVRELRQRQGLTLEQLAARVDAPISVVGRIEGGRRGISISTLFRLARALAYRPADIVSLDPGDEPVGVAHGWTPEEEELVFLWRAAPSGVQGAVVTLLRAAMRA